MADVEPILPTILPRNKKKQDKKTKKRIFTVYTANKLASLFLMFFPSVLFVSAPAARRRGSWQRQQCLAPPAPCWRGSCCPSAGSTRGSSGTTARAAASCGAWILPPGVQLFCFVSFDETDHHRSDRIGPPPPPEPQRFFCFAGCLSGPVCHVGGAGGGVATIWSSFLPFLVCCCLVVMLVR